MDEVYCGEKSLATYGADEWLPDETLEAFKEYKVGIKGPLTTPVGGGIRSLTLLYVSNWIGTLCLRPVVISQAFQVL